MYKNCKKINFCRLCASNCLLEVFSIGDAPLGNGLYFKINEKEKPKYPLTLMLCQKCGHLQLSHKVNQKELYQDGYTYLSGTSKVFVDYLKEYSYETVNEFNLGNGSIVLEIGSNDGTCLSYFKKKKCQVVGIDPANLPAKIANDKGIFTINEFFNSKTVGHIVDDFGYFDLVTSHNALAHVDDLVDIFKSVKNVLKPTGIFIFEVGYRLDVIKNFWFDTIYHEHIDYHALKPLKIILTKLGFNLFKVVRGNQQGGSIRLYSSLCQSYQENDSLKNIIKLEKMHKLYEQSTYNNFFEKMNKIREIFRKTINDFKSKNKKIVGFGVPTKLTTLMTALCLDNNDVSYFVDDNLYKQKKFTPVGRIPIHGTDQLHNDLPDVIIIFAWNFAESIFKKYSYFQNQGVQFIVPLPFPKIL